MNDPSAAPAASVAPEPVSSPVPGKSNGGKHFPFDDIPILPRSMRQPEVPKVQIVDATLQEGDLKVRLNVEIHGRSLRIMDGKFETTICGGIDGRNRGILIQSLEALLEHVQRSVATKVNSALPVEAPTSDEIDGDDNHDFLTEGRKLRLNHT